MLKYHCEDCKYLIEDDHPEESVYKCAHNDAILTFDVKEKIPCKLFHPEEYIRALNADSVTRD